MDPKKEMADLAIVGGGAAGLFAAATAAELGLRCVVLERKARVGSKLLVTGNGRCNFTRDATPGEFLRDLGEPVASFARPAIEACPPARVSGGFRALGLRIRAMPDGRLFPASMKAADVVHVFGDYLRETATPVAVNCPVESLVPVPGGGWTVRTRAFALRAAAVLVATGGLSFPKTGCLGDGYRWARALGHRIVPCRPGLGGYEWPSSTPPVPPGTRWTDAEARVLLDGRIAFRWRGEAEFESWGVGGAAVYNPQRWVERHDARRPFRLEILGPASRVVLDSPRPRPLKEAIVTMGGVALDEVSPDTMESRLAPGLHFAGEVLDIDGPTGGYNLTLAFATAFLAVRHVAAAVR
ncbi:MAG: NAD(P)/FAD-dependent oxidoreductase [Kiritimatiellae bacterium]|nr:NAD(P)/FAD-dependent oxidoreductase [Kiritimatiellia bacterium]